MDITYIPIVGLTAFLVTLFYNRRTAFTKVLPVALVSTIAVIIVLVRQEREQDVKNMGIIAIIAALVAMIIYPRHKPRVYDLSKKLMFG
jgi:Na+-transporting NADH:ubiquinone oxidoreductase subunit NqrD